LKKLDGKYDKEKITIDIMPMTFVYIVVFNKKTRQSGIVHPILLFLLFQGYGYGLYWTVIDCLSTNTSAICLSFLLFVSLSRFLFRITLVKKYNLWSGAVLIVSSTARPCLILNSIIVRLTHSHLFVHIIGVDINLLFFFFLLVLFEQKRVPIFMYMLQQFDLSRFVSFVFLFSGDHTDFWLSVSLCKSLLMVKTDSSLACLLFLCWFNENTARAHPTTTQNQHSLFAVFLPSRFAWRRGVCASARPSISFFRLKSCALPEKLA